MYYFSVHSVRPAKIYFPGSCPVNILIQTHDSSFHGSGRDTDPVFLKNIFLEKKVVALEVAG